MKAITAYKTFDGTIFEDRECAELYELAHVQYRCWDAHGSETDNLDNAIYVYLKTKYDADVFIRDCNFIFSPCNGIGSEDTGLFYWNDAIEEYVYLMDGKSFDGLFEVLKQIKSEEENE